MPGRDSEHVRLRPVPLRCLARSSGRRFPALGPKRESSRHVTPLLSGRRERARGGRVADDRNVDDAVRAETNEVRGARESVRRIDRVTARNDPDLSGRFAAATTPSWPRGTAPPRRAELFGGRMLWSGEHAPAVAKAFHSVTRDAPMALTLWLEFLQFPAASRWWRSTSFTWASRRRRRST